MRLGGPHTRVSGMHHLSLVIRLCVAAAAAPALIPTAANAATVGLEGAILVFRGEGAEGNSLLVSARDDWDTNARYLVLSDSGADRMAVTSGPCAVDSSDATTILCPFDPDRPLRIEGSQARDSISLLSRTDVPDSMPVTILGNGGDDTIKDTYDGDAGRILDGGPGNDEVVGYAGDDRIDGGDGNDTVDGGAGNDEVRAGAGDDVLWGDHYQDPGADLLDGGPGTDQIDEWNIPSADFHPLPTVSLNGIADDGRPGEGDNVVDVEHFKFYINATFSGGDAAETVEIGSVDSGSSNLVGGGGNDVLKAGDTNDTVDGGPGDDIVEGGLGNDTVVGGPGKDMIMGDSSASHCGISSCQIAFGNDTIDARDGEADQVDCGIGEDVARVDAIDTVTGCETVERAGAGAGAAPAGPGDPAAGQPGAGAAPAGPGDPAAGRPGAGDKASAAGALALAGAAKLKALRSGKLAVKVPCAAACRVAVALKARGRTVATGRATLLSRGTAKVKLKVGTQGRRALRGAKRLKATLVATVTGPAGGKRQLTKTVTLG
jgi:Ca2+-binding RTX toxin-like protein